MPFFISFYHFLSFSHDSPNTLQVSSHWFLSINGSQPRSPCRSRTQDKGGIGRVCLIGSVMWPVTYYVVPNVLHITTISGIKARLVSRAWEWVKVVSVTEPEVAGYLRLPGLPGRWRPCCRLESLLAHPDVDHLRSWRDGSNICC